MTGMGSAVLPARYSATALVVTVFGLAVVGALFIFEVHMVSLVALIGGVIIVRTQFSQARQGAIQVATRLVSVDVEQPAVAAKSSSRRLFSSLDTIIDNSPGSREGKSTQEVEQKANGERSGSRYAIQNFDKAGQPPSKGSPQRRRPSDSSDRILGSLESPIWSRAPSPIDENNVLPDPKDSGSGLTRAKLLALPNSSPPCETPPLSARSRGSARSAGSQQIIDELKAQIQKLQEERGTTPRSARSTTSVRSENTQRLINGLQAQVMELKDALKTATRKEEAQPEAISTPKKNSDELQTLLKELQLPEECVKMLEEEGIDFLDDLSEYQEADLVELGFKRGHAKRLLKAAFGTPKQQAMGRSSTS